MKQCFAYIRVSTVKQGEGVSLEAQRDAITDFAGRRNIQIAKWFEEKETAAKRGRPIFDRMVAELRKSRAHGLIIHKIDRSARNFTDWAKIGDLADAGFDIHFTTESLDFRSRGGRLTADIQAVIAADYIRNLREETIKGMMGRLKQGLYPFRAPIGYLDNGGGKPKTFDPDRSPLVKLAFQLYASRGHSMRSLLIELRAKGLTNRNGSPLTLRGVETILNNPFYCGVILIKRTGMTYQGVHSPLISASLFERVQAIKNGKSGPKVTKHNHTYRGLFRCGLCDGPMVPELQKGTVYYRCPVRSCETKTVREDQIQRCVSLCLRRAQLRERDKNKLFQLVESWALEIDADKEQKAIELKMNNVKGRIERLTDALIDRLIDQEAFANRRERLALEEAAIEQERRQIGNRQRRSDQIRRMIELAINLELSHEIAKTQEMRELLKIATSNRKVYGKKVVIEPSKWLVEVKETAITPNGDPPRDRDRIDEQMDNILTGLIKLRKAVGLPWSALESKPPRDSEGRFVRKKNSNDCLERGV